MDALRAIAMLLGIVLHAAIPYRIFTNANWPDDPTFQSVGFDALYLWIHSFRMQLFFLVAGFFARLLYLKIGEKMFIQHRLKRILLPFVLSVIVIVPLSVAPLLFYKFSEIQGLSIHKAIANTLNALKHWNGLVHLWFLYYLMLYYGAMLVLQRMIPERLQSKLVENYARLADFTRPVIFSVIVFFIASLLQINDKILIEPYTGLKPDISQFVYYGIFFLVGYLLHAKTAVIENFKKNAALYLLGGCLLLIPFTYLYITIHNQADTASPMFLLIRLVGACQTVLLVGGALGGFVRFFSNENKTLRYISDAAYWLYLIHLPIVAFMQVGLLQSDIYGWLRFWVIITVTGIITLVTYHQFVRYTLIGTILHGKRVKYAQKEPRTANTIS